MNGATGPYLRPPVLTWPAIDSASVLVSTRQIVEDVRVRWGRSPLLETLDGEASRGSPAAANEVVELAIDGLEPGAFCYAVDARVLGAWIEGEPCRARTLPRPGEEHAVTLDADPHLGGALARIEQAHQEIRVSRIDHCVAAVGDATDAHGLPPAAHLHLGDGPYAYFGSEAKIFPIGDDGRPLSSDSVAHCALSRSDTDILVRNFVEHYGPVVSTRGTILVEGNHDGFWSWLEEHGNLSGIDTANWLRASVREQMGETQGPHGSLRIGDGLHCWASPGPGSQLDTMPDGPPFPDAPPDQHHHALTREQFDYFFDPVTGVIPNHTGWVTFSIHQKVGGCLTPWGLAYGRGDVAQETCKVALRQCYEQAGCNAINPATGDWEYGDGSQVAWTNPFGQTGMQQTHGLFGALVEMLALPQIWGIVKHEGHDHVGQLALVDGIVCIKHSQTGGHPVISSAKVKGFREPAQFLRLADRPDVILAEWDDLATWCQADVGPDAMSTRIIRSVYYDPVRMRTFEVDAAQNPADGALVAGITLRRPGTPVNEIAESFERIVDDSSSPYAGVPGVDDNVPPPVNESVRLYTSSGAYWAHGNSAAPGSDDARSFLAVRDSVIDDRRVLASRVPVRAGSDVAMWMRRVLGGLDREIELTVRFDGTSDEQPTTVFVPICSRGDAPLVPEPSGKGLYLRFDNGTAPSLALCWDDGSTDAVVFDTAGLDAAWVAPAGPGAAFDGGIRVLFRDGHITVTARAAAGDAVTLMDFDFVVHADGTVASDGRTRVDADRLAEAATLIDVGLGDLADRLRLDPEEFTWTGLGVISKNRAGAGHVVEFGRFRAIRLDA